MASAQPCRLHPDRGARLVDLDAESSNRLARKTQLLGVSSRRNEHLGQVYDADQSRGVLLSPGGKQLAGLGMMPVRYRRARRSTHRHRVPVSPLLVFGVELFQISG